MTATITALQLLKDLADFVDGTDQDRMEQLASEYCGFEGPTKAEMKAAILKQVNAHIDEQDPSVAPNWQDAPEWAQYLAQDSDGRWFWYGCEPKAIIENRNWCPGTTGGKLAKSAPQRVHVTHWDKTLQERP